MMGGDCILFISSDKLDSGSKDRVIFCEMQTYCKRHSTLNGREVKKDCT
jgi:hypothetical protein